MCRGQRECFTNESGKHTFSNTSATEPLPRSFVAALSAKLATCSPDVWFLSDYCIWNAKIIELNDDWEDIYMGKEIPLAFPVILWVERKRI